MSDFGTLHGGRRAPTWYERNREARLRDEGVSDVLVAPGAAPPGFWDAVLAASEEYLPLRDPESTNRWLAEFRYMVGFLPEGYSWEIYRDLVGIGCIGGQRVLSELRFAGVELMLDVADYPDAEFEERVNDRARYYRVGLEIENRRFVPLQAEFVHSQVVHPALLLLSEERFGPVDDLFRKAYSRALSSDASGAVTAATSAVEEMLKALGAKGSTLELLVRSARSSGWLDSAEAAILPKLMAIRDDSDAHGTGTSDFDRAMLAINLAAAILVHLGQVDQG